MKRLRSQHKTAAAEPRVSRPAVVFCSGALFFTHVMEWPTGVAEKDLGALVELALEDVSPFALESLAWGFLADAPTRSVLLYACCLPRVGEAEQSAWQNAGHVFPAFLPLLARRLPRTGGAAADTASGSPATASGSAANGTGVATAVSGAGSTDTGEAVEYELLLNGAEVILLEREAGHCWPRRIRVEALGTESSPASADVAETGSGAATAAAAEAPVTFAAAQAAALRLLAAAGADCSAALASPAPVVPPFVPFYRLQTVVEEKRGQLRFVLADAASANAFATATTAAEPTAAEPAAAAPAAPAPLQLQTALESEEVCWQADLRSAAFIALARKRRKSDVRLWHLLCAAAAGAAVLIALWLLHWGLGFEVRQRIALLAVQSPAVERVRQDQDLLTRMRQFSAEPFTPFGLIGGLKGGKPEAIYFDAIELSEPDAIVVEGQGPTVDAVNAYVRSLEQTGDFRAARQARMSLKDGASVFTLYLQHTGSGKKEAAAVPPAATPLP